MTRSRKECVRGFACDPQTLREALHCQVTHHPTVRVDDIAEEIGQNPRTLMTAVNPDASDWLAMRHLAKVLALTPGHYPVARFIAIQQQGVFFIVPEGASVEQTTAMVVCEFGEYLQAQARATADHRITPAALADIERQGRDAIAAIASGIETARRRVLDAPIGVFSVTRKRGGER